MTSVADERAAQGKPPTVTDPKALEVLAAVLTAGAKRKAKERVA